MATALAAEGVSVHFGGVAALTDVDLAVDAGEIVGIIGPNGAGKTTLFDVLSGFVEGEGRVWLHDEEVSDRAPHQRAAAGLGRSFQDARLFPSLTVIDTLRVAYELHQGRPRVFAALFGWASAGKGEDAATDRAGELIETLGLGEHRNKLTRELSTGTRRIVDLGCVLAQGPRVVLLDEPSSGIAQRETEALAPLLRRIRDLTGAALVVIEHDMPLVRSISDRLYALEVGTVIASGPPRRVLRHPEVVRSYLGDDPAAINRSGHRNQSGRR